MCGPVDGIGDRILRLLLDYEAAQRRHENLNNQLETLNQQEQVIRIKYRLGRGSTNQVLGISDKRDHLTEKIVEVEIEKDGAMRELGYLIRRVKAEEVKNKEIYPVSFWVESSYVDLSELFSFILLE